MFDLVRPSRVAGAIEIYDNVFRDCETILDAVQRTNPLWDRATVNDGEISDIRTNDSVFLNLNSLANETVVFEFAHTLFKYLDEYGKRYDVGFSAIQPACINKYEIGQEYKAHADDGPTSPRVISALIYLNDVDEGGETVFTLFNESVKPKKGRLVIFPSNYAYIHEARPPKSGVKYSMAVWCTPIKLKSY